MIFGKSLRGLWTVVRTLTQDEYAIVKVDVKGSMDDQLPTPEYNSFFSASFLATTSTSSF